MKEPVAKRIPLARPYLPPESWECVRQSFSSGWLVQGPMVERFEEAVARYVGSRLGVATTSCTTALQLALELEGLGSGDEVVVPAFTFIATANAVIAVGASPVLCDIDLDTFNLCPENVESVLSASTSALLPVHLFGLPAAMDPLMAIAGAAGMPVVEDAACGLGAFYNGRHLGTFGRVGCFSFHPRKIITTGEGGMLVTDDESLAARARSLRNHGASVDDLSRHTRGGSLLSEYPNVGYNYRMTDIQAGLGLDQMELLEVILARRAEQAARYTAALAEIPWLLAPIVPADCTPSWQAYVARLDRETLSLDVEAAGAMRDNLIQRLAERGVATTQGTHALHMLEAYRERYGYVAQDFPRAWEAHFTTLTLPLYHEMTSDDQDYVIDCLRECGPAG